MTRGVKANIDEYVANITPFLLEGCSINEACSLAIVPYRTVMDYYNDDMVIRNKIDRIKNQYFLMLRESLNREAKEKGELALKVLERKKKDEFSPRSEVETKGTQEVSLSDKDKEILERFLNKQNQGEK